MLPLPRSISTQLSRVFNSRLSLLPASVLLRLVLGSLPLVRDSPF